MGWTRWRVSSKSLPYLTGETFQVVSSFEETAGKLPLVGFVPFCSIPQLLKKLKKLFPNIFFRKNGAPSYLFQAHYSKYRVEKFYDVPRELRNDFLKKRFTVALRKNKSLSG